MRFIILGGSAVIGFLFGTAFGVDLNDETPKGQLEMFGCAMLGTLAGLVSAEILLRVLSPSTFRSHPRVVKSRREIEPQPFRSRLAQFTGRDDSDVLDSTADGRSTMRFWCAREFDQQTSPRLRWSIRRILLRIRSILSERP